MGLGDRDSGRAPYSILLLLLLLLLIFIFIFPFRASPLDRGSGGGAGAGKHNQANLPISLRREERMQTAVRMLNSAYGYA